jgi:hypothetical protein
LKLTDDDVKNFIYSAQGAPRFLAQLEAVGAATGLVGLTRAASTALPAPGDNGPQVLRKYAELKQIVEQSLRAAKTLPGVSDEQKEDFDKTLEQIRTAVPWTVKDINDLERNPNKETVSAFAQRVLGAKGMAAPGGLDVTEEQYNKLPSGSAYTVPGNPKVMIKP